MTKGILYIIAAPSGTGKTSLVKAITTKLSNVLVSISHTTRPIRPGEQEGVNYFFTAREKFMQMVGEGLFLEHAEVFGNLYGTSQAWVEKQINKGFDVILEIDWQGAQQVRRLMPESTVSIFIVPPSLQTLQERLLKRDQDSKEVIVRRLNAAREEVSHVSEFDYMIVNDQFEEALAELYAVIRTRHLTVQAQAEKYTSLLTDLLR